MTSREEFFITKKRNFVQFLLTIQGVDSIICNDLLASSYADLVAFSAKYLKPIAILPNSEVFFKQAVTEICNKYNIDMNIITAAQLDRIKQYLQLFSEI